MMKNRNKYDVIMVGAGPAGMFAADELARKKVLVIDKGKNTDKRKRKINNKNKYARTAILAVFYMAPEDRELTRMEY